MTGNHLIRPDSKSGRSLIRTAKDPRPIHPDIQKWNAEVEAKKKARKEAKQCKS